MKTILVYSGGMDSTTLLYHLLDLKHEVKAISFNYGQRHSRELEMAKKTCEKLGVEHKIIDINFMRDIASNSSLTGDIATPHGHYAAENMKLTVVPNRNMIMYSIAIGWAVNIGYDAIAVGVHAGDFEVYPDCRPVFIQKLKEIAQVANFSLIDVLAPFLLMTKGDIAKRGIELNVDFSITQTCYEGTEKPCMKCGACSERIGSFANAGVKDPLYTNDEWKHAIEIAKSNGIEINA